MPNAQIFQSRNPSRWKKVKWSARIALIVLIIFLAAVAIAIKQAKKPNMPGILPGENAQAEAMRHLPHFRNKKYLGFRDFLLQHHDKKLARDSANPQIRGAFYSPWSVAALTDLRANADKLNTIYPEWFFIDTLSGQLNLRIDTSGLKIMRQHQLSIQPILTNFHSNPQNPKDGFFDPALVSRILHDTLYQKQLIANISDTLSRYGFAGINIDFEALREKSNEPLTHFIRRLSQALHAKDKIVSIDVEADNEDYDYVELARHADHLILMGYDEYSEPGDPGPIASQKWIEEKLDKVSQHIDPTKIILGVAGYGREWIHSQDGNSINDITFSEALQKAKASNTLPLFDDDSYNLHFAFNMLNGDETEDHQVWFTDAATTFNCLRFADEYPTAGTALWRLGAEDPRIWSFYGRDLSNESLAKEPFNFSSLHSIPADPAQKPIAIGEGELISILYTPDSGKLSLGIDSTELLVAEESYQKLPSGYVYKKFGEDSLPLGPGHKIILTFDDGPSAEYTPQILDILEKEKVPATFFVVGINAENNIPILKRIYDDGFEIGNHTFTHGNIAHMGIKRSQLELKTTRLLIESVTGHSTILFRAPYNADSEPQTFEEIEPIARSKEENYITIGESIDPNDWDSRNNADSIYIKTVRLAEATNASIVLLHDAGGETRQPTVDALPRIIKYFKDRGCVFTTVSGLIGKTRDDVMPPVPFSLSAKLGYWFALTTYWLGHFIYGLFIVGIALSAIRIIALAILAYLQKRKEKKETYHLPASAPGVSIIVPAFNEEVNAVRTVQSLLKQSYEKFQIIFVDDGSKDNTFEVVKNAFLQNPLVEVLKKPNGGKASALNFGIKASQYEYLVCIDADTQLKTDALSELMKKFFTTEKNQNVGAVAGNVKVGNEINMISKWQSIEYITSQNFDRRAFDLLNCITVVPGAIGAFRKSAIEESGGFTTDTLAEDCDLTMRILKKGYQIKNSATAIAYTEVPETLKQFLKQRFRWSFGVMQSFWKHRGAMFVSRYHNFGWVALPNILIYQILLPALAPIADLVLLLGVTASGLGIIQGDPYHILLYYIIFSLVDMAGAAVAFTFEKEKLGKLLWMIPQRFVYRQLMYYILLKSVAKALKGELQSWGSLHRTGNVKEPVIN